MYGGWEIEIWRFMMLSKCRNFKNEITSVEWTLFIYLIIIDQILEMLELEVE